MAVMVGAEEEEDDVGYCLTILLGGGSCATPFMLKC